MGFDPEPPQKRALTKNWLSPICDKLSEKPLRSLLKCASKDHGYGFCLKRTPKCEAKFHHLEAAFTSAVDGIPNRPSETRLVLLNLKAFTLIVLCSARRAIHSLRWVAWLARLVFPPSVRTQQPRKKLYVCVYVYNYIYMYVYIYVCIYV